MSSEATPRVFSLPLFPLNCVLFPQFPVQLHIFEERYRAMINHCIENNEPFGVILIREGTEVGLPAIPHDVGCVARILAVKRLDDGRMLLLAMGEERFRLLEYSEAELPYLIGRVETYPDDPAPMESLPELTAELSELFRRYLGLLASNAELSLPDITLPEDLALLTFCVASVAQFSLPDKQRLLEMADPRERMEEECSYLLEQIETLEAAQTAASGEGAEEEKPRVMVALPLDIEEPHWQQFQQDARN